MLTANDKAIGFGGLDEKYKQRTDLDFFSPVGVRPGFHERCSWLSRICLVPHDLNRSITSHSPLPLVILHGILMLEDSGKDSANECSSSQL